jgi:hypothetical protein
MATTQASENAHPFRKVISKSECFGCKLFSVPLFYTFAAYMGNKNLQHVMGFKQTGGKASLVEMAVLAVFPVILFAGGSVNLYGSFRIFSAY